MVVRWCALLLVPGVVLAVAAAPAAPSAVVEWGPPGAPRLIVESGLDRAQTYVQAQAIYTLRFYQAIDVRELQLTGPQTALAELRPIGEARIDEATRGGQRYRVTERRYAVFPFASGALALTGAHVSGLVARAGAAPGERVPLRLDAPPATLEVVSALEQAGPAGWLPARALALSEHWHTDPQQARVGEALIRTVRIEATGVDAAQLTAPESGGDGYAVHPAPPRLENRFDGDWNVGIREQDWHIVPARAGSVVLPELRLPWWDALSGERGIARIPARTLVVAPATVNAVADATPDPASAQAPGAVAAVEPSAPERVPSAVEAGRAGHGRWARAWWWGIAALLVAVAAIAGWRARQPQRCALRELRRACRRNDARAARDALLAWAATAAGGRGLRTLGELAPRLSDPAQRRAVADLDRHLYGPVAQDWNGRALCAVRGRPPHPG